MEFEVKNRFSGEAQFVAEIDCAEDMPLSIKLGLAVKWAIKTGADLADANLAGAYLADANLAGAYLAGADLGDANLGDANLAGAYLARANLARAYLSRADLARAYLAGANLARAYLADANLAGAYLADAKGVTDEQLRPIKADLWMILSMARHEVPALIDALRKARVDGSTYEGECACLVGTLENAGASALPHVPTSPAERWFAAISKGDRPGDDSAGGFASQKALDWTLEYCRMTGIAVEVN